MIRIGKHHLRTLMMVASPFTIMLTADRGSRALVARGLLKRDGVKGQASRITSIGLRALADAMDRGEVAEVIAELEAEHKAKARKTGRVR